MDPYLLVHFVSSLFFAVLTAFLLTRPSKTFKRNPATHPYGVEIAKGRWRSLLTKGRGLIKKPTGGLETLHDILVNTAAKYGRKDAIGWRPINGHFPRESHTGGGESRSVPMRGPYVWASYEEFYTQAIQIGRGLRRLGVSPRQSVAILHETSQFWSISAYGCYSQAVCVCALPSTFIEEKIFAALSHSDVVAVQTSSKQLKSLSRLLIQVPSVKFVVISDPFNTCDTHIPEASMKECGIRIYAWEEVRAFGRERVEFEDCTPTPDDVALMTFSANSFENPKVVAHKHCEVVAAIAGCEIAADVTEGDRYLHYLPLSLSVSVVLEGLCILRGVAMGFALYETLLPDPLLKLRGDAEELRPTVAPLSPNLAYNLFKAHSVSARKHGVLHVIHERARASRLASIQNADDFAFWTEYFRDPVSRQLGGRVRLLLCGGYPLPSPLLLFLRLHFASHIIYGYGVQECCGIAIATLLDDVTGVVGAPLTCAEVEIRDIPGLDLSCMHPPLPRGQLVITGESCSTLAKGATSEAVLDGKVITDDVAEVMSDGNVRIIDRRANIIRCLNGELVSLGRIQSLYRLSPYVLRIMIQPMPDASALMALVDPDIPYLEKSATENGIHNYSLSNEDVYLLVLKDFQQIAINYDLKRHECIAKLRFSPEKWTWRNGTLNSDLSLNRIALLERYQAQFNSMMS